MKLTADQDIYVGDEATKKKGYPLRLTYPIDRGIITSWDDMEYIWRHLFYNELRLSPEECSVILMEPVLNPNADRERMVKIMFETFGVPAMDIHLKGLLSMYSTGRVTGCVLNSGFGVTQIIPNYEGVSMATSFKRLNVGGRDLTERMIKCLSKEGYPIRCTKEERAIICDMKETLGYVAMDYDAALKKSEKSSDHKKKYELPDGNVVSVGVSRFQTPEALFQPSMIGERADGVHVALHKSIASCDIDIRKDLYENVICSGGSTLFDGFPERLRKELVEVAPKTREVKVIAGPGRKYAAWIGGSVIAEVSWGPSKWISKSDYEEYGPRIVRQRLS